MTVSLVRRPRMKTENTPPDSTGVLPPEGIESVPLDRPDVAELSMQDIHRMDDHELICLIRAVSALLPQPDVEHRLDVCDRPTLERLAQLARHCCRKQGY